MSGADIHIKLEAYDSRELLEAVNKILNAAKRTNAEISGPIPMKRKLERFTVNRSPHIDKKSREQFEIRTHTRLIIIKNIGYNNQTVVEALGKISDLPPSVGVKIQVKDRKSAS